MAHPMRSHPTRQPRSILRPIAAIFGLSLLLTLPILSTVLPASALAHPGGLDEWGGHFDSNTSLYHYHRPKMNMARRKREFLSWMNYPHKGSIRGVVAKIDRPNALWVRVPYRPAYQEMVPLLSPIDRDDKSQMIRVWLVYVSPEETGKRGKNFTQWFREKVIYELALKLKNREVTVQFELLGGDARRIRGMVFAEKENINLWLVLSGWSYYVINEGKNPYDKLFRQAEDLARRDKSGIWRPTR